MRFRLAAAALGVVLSLPGFPAYAFEGPLFRVRPEGTWNWKAGGTKPALAVISLDRQHHTVAQAQQDRRADPPTSPGRGQTPPTAPGVTPPPAPGFAPSNWGSVFKWFEERVQLVRFNVEGVFTASEFQTGSNAGPQEGGRFSGVIAPGIRLAEDSALVFVYNASYNRDLQVFREDEGPRRRSEEQRHEFIALLSQDFVKPLGISFINRLTLSPSVFQTYAFTRQTASEEWRNGIPLGGVQKFKGLYDYWDRGAGIEVKLLHEREGERKHTLSASVQSYLRHYRNFTSLARQLDPASPEPKFEKDYVGVLTRAAYEFQAPGGTSLRLGYSQLNRYFTEDRARIDPLVEAGVPGERRRDITDTVEGRMTYGIPLVKGLVVGLGGSWSNNRSTSGFNDTLSPLPAAGVFSEHYYDYWSFRLDPDLAYTQELDLQLFGLPIKGILTLSFSYSYDRRAYRDREAKDKDGGFRDAGLGGKDANEADVTHTFAPRIVYQFRKNWALLLEAKKNRVRSNFQDERVYRECVPILVEI